MMHPTISFFMLLLFSVFLTVNRWLCVNSLKCILYTFTMYSHLSTAQLPEVMFAYRPPLPSTPQYDYTTSWNRSNAIFLCLNRMVTTPHLKTWGKKTKKQNKSTQVHLKCSVHSCPDRSYITVSMNAINMQTTNTLWQTTSLEFDTLLCGKNACCDDAKSPVATVTQLSQCMTDSRLFLLGTCFQCIQWMLLIWNDVLTQNSRASFPFTGWCAGLAGKPTPDHRDQINNIWRTHKKITVEQFP